jgi:hypothetical protein
MKISAADSTGSDPNADLTFAWLRDRKIAQFERIVLDWGRMSEDPGLHAYRITQGSPTSPTSRVIAVIGKPGSILDPSTVLVLTALH